MTTLNQIRKELALAFATRCNELGFETYLAERGTYGFYTNADGSRIVTFDADYYGMGVNVSGAYQPSTSNGTGWRIRDLAEPPQHVDEAQGYLLAVPLSRQLRGPLQPYTTRAQHLARYGKSSHYIKL